MNSKESDESEKVKTGVGGFDATVGVYILGMVCCLAGPVAVLAGVAGLKAWLNGLHPFVIAVFVLVSAVLAIVWMTRKRRRGSLIGNEAIRLDPTNCPAVKTSPSTGQF